MWLVTLKFLPIMDGDYGLPWGFPSEHQENSILTTACLGREMSLSEGQWAMLVCLRTQQVRLTWSHSFLQAEAAETLSCSWAHLSGFTDMVTSKCVKHFLSEINLFWVCLWGPMP